MGPGFLGSRVWWHAWVKNWAPLTNWERITYWFNSKIYIKTHKKSLKYKININFVSICLVLSISSFTVHNFIFLDSFEFLRKFVVRSINEIDFFFFCLTTIFSL